MAVPLIDRLSAFFDNVWSFILTLVRSLLALFFFRRRSDLSTVNRIPNDTLARAQSHLRPILLTPRSISRSPGYYSQRAQSTRSHSPTSTLFPAHNEGATASGPVPQASDPQRTSPKLDPNDPELGLSVTASLAGDRTEPPGTSTTSFRGATPDTSLPATYTSSFCTLPLTPPDRCYLAPMPSVIDCPYVEPWSNNVALDRSKPRFPGSPLKVSINTDLAFPEPMVAPVVSPPPGPWSPLQIWTSTPCKSDHLVTLSPFQHHSQSAMDHSSVLANISHALISRSRSAIQPYDDASYSITSSEASLSVSHLPVAQTLQRTEPTDEYNWMHLQASRHENQSYPRFHYPDAYLCTWHRHGTRVPGKPDRTAHTHTHAHSLSHMDLPVSEWYDADAYIDSPASVLSPPLCESTTEGEDEDDIPLGRLRTRLARRGAVVGLGVPIGAGVGMHKTVAHLSPRTRRMSEGCLLAISELTPTRVGVGASASRNVLSLALGGDGDSPKDWLEALSLHFSSEQKDAPATSVLESHTAVPPIEGVAMAS